MDAHEDMFWNTPAASTRPLRFTDNLLDEEVTDLADISMASFASPMPPPRKPPPDYVEEYDESGLQNQSIAPVDFTSSYPDDDREESSIVDEEDKTVILKKQPPLPSPPTFQRSPSPIIDPEPPAEVHQPDVQTNPVETPKVKTSKIKVTAEVERIVVRLLFLSCALFRVNITFGVGEDMVYCR